MLPPRFRVLELCRYFAELIKAYAGLMDFEPSGGLLLEFLELREAAAMSCGCEIAGAVC